MVSFYRGIGLLPSQGDGVVKPLLQFDVGEPAEGDEEVQIGRCRLRHGGLEVIGHAFEAQVDEFGFEVLHGAHERFLLIMKVSNSARDGSSRRI